MIEWAIDKKNANKICTMLDKGKNEKNAQQQKMKIEITHHFLCSKKFRGIVRLWIRAVSL